MPTKSHRKTRRQKISLITRKEAWTLTAQGWLVVIAFIASLGVFLLTHIHPFLAVNSPIKAGLLVVEGWIPDYALQQALIEFRSGSYQKIITTGIPLERGSYLVKYNNFASLAAASLEAIGLEKEKLVAVSTPDVKRDRTYTSAVAFRQWLLNSNLKINSINLYSFDVHARRSWLSFKHVLAPNIKVGVIASKPIDYNPNKWWSSSTGVRRMISESVGYIYGRFVNIGA